MGKPIHEASFQGETTKMNVELKPDVNERLSEIARECNLPLEKTCEIILSAFAAEIGGRIFLGRWKEANGLRFVVQWPFFAKITRLNGDELVRIGVKPR